MRVFLDANILFSAANEASATRVLLDRLLGHGVAVTHEHAWEEARRNLLHKRTQFLDGLLELRPRLEFTTRLRRVPDVSLPDKDLPVLFGAVGAGCTHLWTSDQRHFGPLYGKTIQGTKVVSSIQLADELGTAVA